MHVLNQILQTFQTLSQPVKIIIVPWKVPLLLLANNLNSEVARQLRTVVLATEMRQVISIAINISATLGMSTFRGLVTTTVDISRHQNSPMNTDYHSRAKFHSSTAQRVS